MGGSGMSQPNFRALCKDLADDLDEWMEYGHSPANLPFEEGCTQLLIKRARAAADQLQTES